MDDSLFLTLAEIGGGKASKLNKEAVQRDAGILNKRLKRINRMLLDPRSKKMQYWDFVTIFALFFTAILTPYEVCMLWAPTEVDALFIVNYFVNSIFMFDTLSNFFLPFRETRRRGGGIVKNHRKIALRYLKGWFIIDLVSILPFDILVVSGLIDTNAVNPSMLRMIRMIRLMRLLKLARILRASRLFSRWENSISIQYGTRTMVQWMCAIVLTLHWFACLLGLLAQMQGSLRDNSADVLEEALKRRIQWDSQCTGCLHDDPTIGPDFCGELKPCLTPCEIEELAYIQLGSRLAPQERFMLQTRRIEKNEHWVCRQNNLGVDLEAANHFHMWMAAVYVAMLQMGGGVGSINPENFAEYVLWTICLLLGSVLWAIVVGTICGLTATGDPHEIKFRQSMDSLNYFLIDMDIPQPVRVKTREYLRQTRDLSKHQSYFELVDMLSPNIRSEVILTMSEATLKTVPCKCRHSMLKTAA